VSSCDDTTTARIGVANAMNPINGNFTGDGP
jgi:hypothetical protein